MGFSGGGSNITKPHTHDSSIVQDGGSLAANVTQFGLTNGSLLYSDGTNIQELGVGASGYVLGTAGSTVPTWEAGSAGGAWTLIASQTVAGTTIDTTSLSACDSYSILDFWACCDVDTGAAAEMQTYNSATDTLNTGAYYNNSGYAFGAFGSDQLVTSYHMTLGSATSTESIFIHATIYNPPNTIGDNGFGYITFNDRNNGGAGVGVAYKGAGAGDTIRGFKLINPTNFDNAYWMLMGA
jgi:hypothetical protein